MVRPPGPSASPFSAQTATKVLAESCRAAGLDSTGARPLRLGENALFHLPAESAVVRIARTLDYWPDAVNEVNVSRWLADQGVTAARTLDLDQPIDVHGHPVTYWHFIDGRDGARDDLPALAHILRDLHALPRPTTFALPDENIMIRDGAPVLIDFERFAWGHPEWDLAMTATEHLSAGWWTPAEYAIFADAYGFDVMSWTEGFPVLRRVHELKMTTWLMQNITESPDIADEYQLRMRTIRDGIKATWRPF